MTSAMAKKRRRPLPPLMREAIASCMDAYGCTWFEALKEVRAKYPDIQRAAATRSHERLRQEALLRTWTHPAGTPVWVRRDDGREEARHTESEPWMMGGHTPMIMLHGIVGGYCLERVRVREQ